MVYILLKDGFEEAEALIPVDVLRRAGAEVMVVADGIATGGHGIAVGGDIAYGDVRLDHAEMIILPGGMGGVNNLWGDTRVQSLLTDADARGILLAAICAAPMILGRLGLLDGKIAVCYPGCEGDLRGANTSHTADIVTDGRITTGKAAGVAYAFALELARILCGAEKANAVRDAMFIADPAAILRV